jgi:hypothetical protein
LQAKTKNSSFFLPQTDPWETNDYDSSVHDGDDGDVFDADSSYHRFLDIKVPQSLSHSPRIGFLIVAQRCVARRRHNAACDQIDIGLIVVFAGGHSDSVFSAVCTSLGVEGGLC